MNIIISIIYTLIYALTNLLLGLFLLKLGFKERLKEQSILVMLVTGFLLGEGILTGVWLLLGALGWFKLPAILGILIAIIILSVFIWHDLIIFFKIIAKNSTAQFKNLSIFWRAIVLTLIVLILFFGAGAIILPPTSDAEAFYMVLPKIIAYAGKLIPQPNYYEVSKGGVLGQIHFAALMSIADSMAAKFFVWFNALATAGILLALGRLVNLKTKGQIITMAILFTSPTFFNYITDGKVDIFGAVFGLAAYYWVLKVKGKSWLPLILTGLFMGLAVMAKLSNALVIIPGILLILGWHRYLDYKNERKSIKDFIRETILSGVIVGVFFILALAPHFIKNEVLFNSPLASPYTVEQSGNWSVPVWSPVDAPSAMSSAVEEHFLWLSPVWIPIEHMFFVFITCPLAFVLWDYPGKGGNLSVLVLAFLPLLWFWRPINLAQKQILTMSLVGVAIWLIIRSTIVSPRYVLATLLLILPIIASRAESIFDQRKPFIGFLLKFIIGGSIFLLLLIQLTNHFYMVTRFGRAVFSRSNPTVLYGPHYPALEFINQRAKANDRVFLFGYYAFYLKPGLLVNLSNNQEKLEFFLKARSAPWEFLRTHRFKYVVIQKDTPFDVVGDMENNPRPDWVTKIYSDSDNDVYQLDD